MANVEIRDIPTEETAPTGTELAEIQKSAGGVGSSKKITLNTNSVKMGEKQHIIAQTVVPTGSTSPPSNFVIGATQYRADISSTFRSWLYMAGSSPSVTWAEVLTDKNGPQVKVTYESEADTNAYNDADKTTVGNQSGTNTGDEVQATETTAGNAEVATQPETDGGTDDLRIVTPLKLENSAFKTSHDNHLADVANPHSVTKSQVGLGNADNTSDANKPISTATQTALDGKSDDPHTHDEISNVANDRIIGRVAAGSGNSEELTSTQVRTLINVEDGANKLPVLDTTALSKDPVDNTKTMRIDVGAVATGTLRILTMPDQDIDLADIVTNNSKITNATHTGDVTGSGALTVDPTAITGKATVTSDSGDFVLVSDTSDSGNLKKVDVADFGGGGGLNNIVEDTTPQLGGALDVNGNEITGAIDLHSTGDVITELGDAAGSNKLSIRDSGAVEVAAIDSDGNITTSGTVDGRDVDADGTTLDTLDADAVLDGDFDAQTILLAVTDNTPAPLTIAASRFVGRKAAGDAGVMTVTEARTELNVADGSTSNSSDAVLLARANHTGTQTLSTISDAGTAAASNTGDFATSAQGSTADSALQDLVDDTTPQLGGDLDCNQKKISNYLANINAQTGTTYTTVNSDSGKIVTLNNASSITITIHSGAVAGFNCTISQKGAGIVTVAAGGTGVLRNRSSHTDTAGQYAVLSCFVESNAGSAPEVYLAGDTA